MTKSITQTTTGLTYRAILLGIGIVVFINLWVTYAETVVQSSRLNLSFFQLPLFFIFLFLLGCVNPILTRFRIAKPLSATELLAIVAIGLVGAVVPGSGVAGFLMGIISTPFYFATPENAWAQYYHPHLPSWIVPTEIEETRAFYEGLRPDQTPNWWIWIIPLLWWSSLILAIFAGSACLMVLLRKQWAEHEKLAYPLAEVPIEMTEDIKAHLTGLYQSRLFWIGAGIAFSLFAWNALSWFYPTLPNPNILPSAGYFRFARNAPGIYLDPFQFFTIGFAYFANLQLLFSIWVFFALYIIEGLIFTRLGFQIQSSIDSFSADPPTQAWKCFGALACLVFWRLWIARQHLTRIWHHVFTRKQTIDDSQEMVSYRTAVWVLIISVIYALFWLMQIGFDLTAALMFLFAMSIIYLGIARVVAETGVAYAQATVTPQAFVMDLRGTHAMTAPTLTGIMLSYSLIDYMRGLFTPGLAHTIRLGDHIKGNKRTLLLCAAIGVFAGLLASAWLTLHMGHQTGAYNFSRLFFNGNPKAVFSTTLAQMRTPKLPDPNRYLFLGLGIVQMSVLTLLHYRFRWWPLHPIGLVLSASDNHKSMVLPVFITWAAKSIIMRVGGVHLYRRAKPLFMGLLVGYTCGVVFSFIVDIIWFPGQGHSVHNW